MCPYMYEAKVARLFSANKCVNDIEWVRKDSNLRVRKDIFFLSL